nr:hypothetical protein [uncultured Allomuricauda sp.]
MTKFNLLKINLLIIGTFLISCSKESNEAMEDTSRLSATEYLDEAHCWDLNNNGIADRGEDKNKDGKVDTNDCNQR